MKTISIVVPTYNEEENIFDVYSEVTKLFKEQLQNYTYELLFIDNDSSDSTRNKIEELCFQDKNVKAIFNIKNFGFSRSIFYGLTQATGNAVVLMFCDMQDPPSVIPKFVKQWEQGSKIVLGVKDKSEENKAMYSIRSLYYKIIDKISEVKHIHHFNGFGLYDESFIKVLSDLDDPLPYFRGIVAELGKYSTVNYTHVKRINGKTNFNFIKLYDVAMLGITSYSKVLLRVCTFVGAFIGALSLIVAIIAFIIKLTNWDYYPIGVAAMTIAIFFIGAVQLFFLGIIGEYILSINIRTMHHPIVIEDKRINFEKIDHMSKTIIGEVLK